MRIEYYYMDPTGNITILVSTPIPENRQPAVAAILMEREPEAEQVGFLSEKESYDISLRMAGGEFCGNASMCAAVIAAKKAGRNRKTVRMQVSGSRQSVCAAVQERSDGTWKGTVEMPQPLSVETASLSDGRRYPVVCFEGIAHCIIEETIPRGQAERFARQWCRQLEAEALGLMFLERQRSRLTPLVYVPGADTLCWENSCASGTSAVGAFLAREKNAPVDAVLQQPGGSLRIAVSENGSLQLTGSVCLRRRTEVQI